MYLKKLEISGFKSFADKTILDFPPGVTAIVGPNGSGKSNIADAVTWVLGEQSMKSLRGKKSEDIIFTGSDKKSKMNLAIVSLFLDNNDKKIPLDYEEVIITRKLFRNGESEYLINKNRVRLVDIVDLLLKSGVSKKGYCVVNQGMTDSILAATPTERMVIFEEATGVRKFQIKKQQTINKLETTKENLQRATDLLNEIQPRLSSLKRQANRAQKRGEIEENLKKEQEKLFRNIWKGLNRDNKEYDTQREDLKNTINALLKELDEVKAQLSQNGGESDIYQKKFSDLQKEADSWRTVINDLQKNLSVIEGRIQIEEEKKEKEENPEYIPINLGYVKDKLRVIISMHDKFISFIEKLSDLNNIEAVKEEGVKIKKNVESLLEEVKDGRVSQWGKKIIFDDSNLRKLNREKKETLEKISVRERKYEEIKNKIYKLNREDQEKRKSFFDLERKLQNKQDKLNSRKDDLNRINVELAKFEVRKEDLLNEIKDEIGGAEFLDKISKNDFESMENDEHFDQDESRSKVRKLRIQLEQIGGIDPLIVEEYEETKKRFEFLSAQSNDLSQASDSLKRIIKELDEKIEDIFKHSFKRISEEFDRYFKMIFGGGRANLSIKYTSFQKNNEDGNDNIGIEEEQNIQEDAKQKIAGIEINLTLPGKKISGLNMLSGGERALTSAAILFAIISNNPPPFSILDEIDAALDETNSERLSRIIKDVSSKTQFVLITHNREVMKQADILYGVTMQGDGVSKIISLKLEEEK